MSLPQSLRVLGGEAQGRHTSVPKPLKLNRSQMATRYPTDPFLTLPRNPPREFFVINGFDSRNPCSPLWCGPRGGEGDGRKPTGGLPAKLPHTVFLFVLPHG